MAADLNLDVKVVTRIDQHLREVLFHTTELEGARLSGEIELDESYFGGKRKGQRGRGAAARALYLACWSAMGVFIPM